MYCVTNSVAFSLLIFLVKFAKSNSSKIFQSSESNAFITSIITTLSKDFVFSQAVVIIEPLKAFTKVDLKIFLSGKLFPHFKISSEHQILSTILTVL